MSYLAADEEEEHVIAQANASVDAEGRLTEDRVLVRRGPQGTGVRVGAVGGSYGTTSEIDFVPPSEVDLMDVSPKQIVSVSTALIPFVEHDDANRALMGANMQKQAVPLVVPEAPYIGTGVEARAARDAGDVLLAEGNGTVTEISGDSITVEYASGQKDRLRHRARRARCTASPSSAAPTRTRASTTARWWPRARAVTTGDLLADGPSTHNGELALGKNLLVAFMPWEGYNYEDAIILSERLVRDDVLTSIHIEEHEVDARDTKLGAEEITRDIPNLSEEILADLDDRGIIRVGAEVEPGDVLVGKVTPKGETEQTPEERLLRAIFGEKAREVRDTSLKVPHGEYGKVIDVRVFSREESHELPPGVNQLVRVYVAQKRKISEGDKLAGRHGNKGVISKILPVEDMPYLADGTPVDIILNPLGVPSRMNVGQVLESHLGYAARHGWEGIEVNEGVGTSAKGDGAARKTRPRTEPAAWVSTPVFDGAHWDETEDAGTHPTIKQVFGQLNSDSANGNRNGNGSSNGIATANATAVAIATADDNGTPSATPTGIATVTSNATAGHGTDRRRPPPRHRRQGHALQRADRRGVRQPDLGRLRLHPEAGPPGGRQDPRPLHRPVLDDHPAAPRVGRRSSVASASARWRCGPSRPSAPPTRCRSC